MKTFHPLRFVAVAVLALVLAAGAAWSQSPTVSATITPHPAYTECVMQGSVTLPTRTDAKNLTRAALSDIEQASERGRTGERFLIVISPEAATDASGLRTIVSANYGVTIGSGGKIAFQAPQSVCDFWNTDAQVQASIASARHSAASYGPAEPFFCSSSREDCLAFLGVQ